MSLVAYPPRVRSIGLWGVIGNYIGLSAVETNCDADDLAVGETQAREISTWTLTDVELEWRRMSPQAGLTVFAAAGPVVRGVRLHWRPICGSA